jgi:hypothetical protein
MLPVKYTNTQTDRIYLATETGLVQCLHEAEQATPIQFNASRKAPDQADEQSVLRPKGAGHADGEAAPHKVAPKEHHVAPKKAKSDDAGAFGDQDPGADEAPAKGGAKAHAKAAAKDKGGAADKPDADDPFGKN